VAALCAAAAVLSLGITTHAQDVSGPNLKAAYIYRFALFTQWPADVLPPDGPLTMCVVGDTAVRDALERTVDGLTVDKRPIVVAFGQRDRPPETCHMLYMSSVSSALAARLVAGLRTVPVLTMSDLEGFNRMGGIAEFFYEAGQLRFSIRIDAVKESHLQLSSRLLQLGRPAR
jgi:hypothetical protein